MRDMKKQSGAVAFGAEHFAAKAIGAQQLGLLGAGVILAWLAASAAAQAQQGAPNDLAPNDLANDLASDLAGVPAPRHDGFYLRGGFEAEYLSYGDQDELGGYIDFDLGMATGTLFGLPLGIEIGAEGFSEHDSGSALYGALRLDTGLGTLGFGVPRFALDKYVDTPSIGGFRLIEVFDMGLIDGRGVSGLFYLTGENQPYGVSYDLVRTNFALGASYHQFDDDKDTRAAQLAVNLRQGPFVLGLGGEYIDSDAGHSAFATASLMYRVERFDLGLAHSRLETTIDFAAFLDDGPRETLGDLGVDLVADGKLDTTKAWVTWRPTERLDLTASYITFDGAGEDAWGLNARYRLAGAFVEAGAIDGIGRDTLYTASVGFDF